MLDALKVLFVLTGASTYLGGPQLSPVCARGRESSLSWQKVRSPPPGTVQRRAGCPHSLPPSRPSCGARGRRYGRCHGGFPACLPDRRCVAKRWFLRFMSTVVQLKRSPLCTFLAPSRTNSAEVFLFFKVEDCIVCNATAVTVAQQLRGVL